MASPIHSVTPAIPAPPSSSNPATAAAVASVHASAGEANSNTRVNSLEDLKKKAPDLYKKMMEGIAMHICGEMREHQARLKKLMREATDQR